MNENLSLLIKLQEQDTALIALNKKIKAIPAKIASSEQPLKNAQDALQTAKQSVSDAEKRKRDKERELDDLNAQIEKMKARTSDIKDNKTYQAHIKEIEQTEAKRLSIEDDILANMESVEQESKKIKDAQAVLDRETAVYSDAKRLLDLEVKEAEAGLAELKAKRASLARNVPDDDYEEYMRIMSMAGGLAVVEAVDEICRGCNLNIMPQLYVEIKKNARLNKCPQCKRILYYTGPPQQEQ